MAKHGAPSRFCRSEAVKKNEWTFTFTVLGVSTGAGRRGWICCNRGADTPASGRTTRDHTGARMGASSLLLGAFFASDVPAAVDKPAEACGAELGRQNYRCLSDKCRQMAIASSCLSSPAAVSSTELSAPTRGSIGTTISLPTLLPAVWDLTLQTQAASSWNASARSLQRVWPTTFVNQGIEFHIAAGGASTPWEQMRDQAQRLCGAEGDACVQRTASAAEDAWISLRKQRYRDIFAARGLERSVNLFNVVSVNLERWLISRDALSLGSGGSTRGAPLRLLELGTYEGVTAAWLSENLLQRAEDRLLCVDLWQAGYSGSEASLRAGAGLRRRFHANLARTPNGHQVLAAQSTTVVALSALLAKTQFGEADAFDFVYVDAGHAPEDVMVDAVLALRLLRVGGIAFFDDYGGGDSMAEGLDPFLRVHQHKFELLERPGQQLLLRKLKPVLAGDWVERLVRKQE